MSNQTDRENRQAVLTANICNLLYDLGPSTYDEIRPKVEFWIDYVLEERFMTTSELADRLTSVAWDSRSSQSDISRFLKEFRDGLHRSELVRTFIGEFSTAVLRWFSVASSEDLWVNWTEALVSKSGGVGFMRAASFVGHLIECGLLDHSLVQRHVLKPLTAHYYNESNFRKQAVRAHAIYGLFTTAGNTLLQGLLKPEEVEECFDKLKIRVSIGDIGGMDKFDEEKLNEFHEIHARWLQHRKEEEQRNTTTGEAPAPGQADTPAAPTGVDDSSSTSKSVESLSMLRDMEFSSDTLIDARISTPSSPTLSVSTISDLTPTELYTGESERILTRHNQFYLEDGNVEIVCGRTVFRIHSSTISLSSSRLRDIFSPSTLLNAPTPEGCPRIVSADSAEDFAVLLKMVTTPGFPAWHKVPEFTAFASLLRMASKYGYSDVREYLFHRLKDAYPTKLEVYQAASVLGEGVFGSPKPHPNEVLNLFLDQNVRFAIPVAAYRAGLGGFSSIISNDPGLALPRLALAAIFHGMDVIRSEVFWRAYGIVSNMSSKVCVDRKCVASCGEDSTDHKMNRLDAIYDFMVRGDKGDVLSSLSLGDVLCVDCATTAEEGYDRLRATIWENLPCIFRVGKSWEEL